MAEQIHDAERLAELQALPLERKIQISQARIIEWYKHYKGNIVVSFSGGKDSTVLLHLVRSIFPDVKAVFSNTGLEYPEIQQHVKNYNNIDIVTPSMRFDRVISNYGYPLISKEVAEAIYYARRLRSQTVNVERERETSIQKKRTEMEGKRKKETETHTVQTLARQEDPQVKKTVTKIAIGGGGPEALRTMLRGEYKSNKNNLIQTSTAKNRRTVLIGRMCRTGVVNAINTPTKSGDGTNSEDSEQPG